MDSCGSAVESIIGVVDYISTFAQQHIQYRVCAMWQEKYIVWIEEFGTSIFGAVSYHTWAVNLRD